ncbi:MAG: xanthine dehydrogenase family protein molybdopterin-binding subunit, partial [Candidatus Limnocylindrales bacterium]
MPDPATEPSTPAHTSKHAARATPSATGVGAERPRADSRDKVLGAIRYADDLPFPGLLQARLVQSVYAHARIRSIDAQAALAVPGVVAVLTARDLPIRDRDAQRLSEPLAASEAVFAGQPLALVVAETAEAAADAAELVVVDVDPLEPVVDAALAMGRSSVLARELPGGDAPEEGRAAEAEGDGPEGDGPDDAVASGNVSGRTRHQLGDPEASLEACEAVVEGHFETSWIYQGYLEPHSATAWIDPDGTLVVEAATQGTFYTRRELARLYGLSPAAVRVIGTPLGGSFGSKFLILEPLVAGAALRLRRPVRLTLTRREDFSATNPAPGTTIDLRLGARDGKLAALTARIVLDAGAFDESAVDSLCAYLIAGPYHWPTFDIEAFGVRTNRFGTGQYRGP